jgi:hypothetical protein
MQIDLSNDTTEKLAGQATAAGFSSVEQYVTEFVHVLAERPSVDEVFAPLIDKELAASLAMIHRGIEQIRSGEGLNVEEARRRSLASLGKRC